VLVINWKKTIYTKDRDRRLAAVFKTEMFLWQYDNSDEGSPDD
jgi:hypothetical protein